MPDEATDLGSAGFRLMFYNARWYDPYLSHFTQADTIVPDQNNPQDWDRYSYVRNNPIRYTDPSGHNEDCGLGDPYCQAGKLTPGGLIKLYRLYYGKDIDMRDSEARNMLSAEIEDFMNNNPEYYPQKDIYLGAEKDYESRNVFSQIREDYWMHRFVEETGTWEPGEVGRLMAYYDFHQDVTVTEWSSSEVSWPNVALDAAGIPLGIYGGNVTKFGKIGGYVLQGTSYVDSAASLIDAGDKSDSFGGWLAFISAFPVVGPFASGVSLVRDLAQGSQPVTWYPSIPR